MQLRVKSLHTQNTSKDVIRTQELFFCAYALHSDWNRSLFRLDNASLGLTSSLTTNGITSTMLCKGKTDIGAGVLSLQSRCCGLSVDPTLRSDFAVTPSRRPGAPH
ncbi:hypothetical protein EYF80_063284 [Liparis tanakae]|uniref:Uncharacterized protein n=1 Tax=Liparis tanakae TaxID=230148 RepID=A0A4Z2EDE4_9TELE|nr:hypothetical protein EYF80_063284 [Liparis tanakae]